jgi:putative flippase GtrA
MIRLSKCTRRYLFTVSIIYLLTVFLTFLMYFILIVIDKHIPLVTRCIYSVGENILHGLTFFITPLRYLLPSLTDDEYYLVLVNSIIVTFALVYAYLFCKWNSIKEKYAEIVCLALQDMIRPDLFTNASSIPNTVYTQWLEVQRRRFQEIRRAG